MKFSKRTVSGVVSLCLLAGAGVFLQSSFAQTAAEPEPTRLGVVWSSGDADVAHRVCFLYTLNAKKQGWFDDVSLVVWGPSARLLAGDKDLQAEVRKMQEAGVVVEACVVCADAYGVAERLRELGITVKPMGKPLTDMLQNDWKVLTF